MNFIFNTKKRGCIIPEKSQLYKISDDKKIIASILLIDDRDIVFIPKIFTPQMTTFDINRLGVYDLVTDIDYTLEEFLNK